MSTRTHAKKIVIAGGGFAGIRTARQLAGHGFDVTVVTPNLEFAYYPQLYHAATGGVRSEASIPLYDMLAGTGVKLVQDRLTVLPGEDHAVMGESGATYRFNKLVLALGSVTNYFGIPGLAEHTYDIKSIDGAERFKRHLHQELTEGHRPKLHYVIVGGGPTGIELAAALQEYMGRIGRLHGIVPPKFRIDLIEAGPRLLPRSPEDYAGRIHRRLVGLGVNVMTGAKVESASATGITVDGREIPSHAVVWTAGVATNPFFRNNADHFEIAKNGRIIVNDHMEARPDIYVLGDNAATQYGGLALTAVNDANFAARDIRRWAAGRERPAYRQPRPITVLPVADNWAAVEYGRAHLYGYPGWLLRRIADLVAYRDMEPTGRALMVWLQDGRRQDDCTVCSLAPA